MLAKTINSVLEKHPYYAKLSDADKISVLNLALINYWNQREEITVHGVVADGEIGWDSLTIDNDEIYVLSQANIGVENLSSYRSVDKFISTLRR